MKFGVRECANITFKAKSPIALGKYTFKKGQPVLYIDTAKTSTLEGASTTVYAQGGRGNARLIAWEGEKTLTFTVEDALLSPISMAMLTGAGLFSKKGSKDNEVNVHMTTQTTVGSDGVINLEGAISGDEKINADAPIFVMEADNDGSIVGLLAAEKDTDYTITGKVITLKNGAPAQGTTKNVFVDYYIAATSAQVTELQIDAEHFAGYYYVEADTLFREQSTGVDLPAIITLPNVKIQSNFSFAMSGSGDPSTFTFTMDALPGYTVFDDSKKVLCVIQTYDINAGKEAEEAEATVGASVMDFESTTTPTNGGDQAEG